MLKVYLYIISSSVIHSNRIFYFLERFEILDIIINLKVKIILLSDIKIERADIE